MTGHVGSSILIIIAINTKNGRSRMRSIDDIIISIALFHILSHIDIETEVTSITGIFPINPSFLVNLSVCGRIFG
jgi:hypothetical protein